MNSFNQNSIDYDCSLMDTLTSREIEILKWSAKGKTVHEISIIISVSERTVTFHITNAVQKLNACNKISAIVKAVTLGLLELPQRLDISVNQ